MNKVLSLVLLFSILILSLSACADKYTDESSGGIVTSFDPYSNVFKDDVPTGKKISVKGKKFYFESIEVRDKNADKQVTAENALKELYMHVTVEFSDEDVVRFKDSGYDIFEIPETKAQRDGNVMMIKNTNSEGYTYDVRIEIHKDKIIVIHEGHTYNNPGTYSTITFK